MILCQENRTFRWMMDLVAKFSDSKDLVTDFCGGSIAEATPCLLLSGHQLFVGGRKNEGCVKKSLRRLSGDSFATGSWLQKRFTGEWRSYSTLSEYSLRRGIEYRPEEWRIFWARGMNCNLTNHFITMYRISFHRTTAISRFLKLSPYSRAPLVCRVVRSLQSGGCKKAAFVVACADSGQRNTA